MIIGMKVSHQDALAQIQRRDFKTETKTAPNSSSTILSFLKEYAIISRHFCEKMKTSKKYLFINDR
ncbi:MAG: hypothetical protein MJ117_08040, partial [Lachnospiraceae bacterium]|nr:hypothetical protein [Lachnospiraceae bacterium]